MNRISLIQRIIDKGGADTYLEIGCQTGASFFPIRCKYKIAVDPVFLISSITKLKWIRRNPCNLRNRFFKETSDDFFEKQKLYLQKFKCIDVILIDGLHTYDASLKDVLNSLQYLSNDGVIIMHDCYPPNKAAATPVSSAEEAEKMNLEGWSGEWCGDVWKTIVYLKRAFPGLLEIYVLETDYGLGIIKKKYSNKPGIMIDINLFDEINCITYEEMILTADKSINLKPADYEDFLIQGSKHLCTL